MKTTRQLIVILAGAIVGAGAFAQEATPDTWMKVASSTSHDAVSMESGQARIDASSEAYDFAAHAASGKTRGQVRAELLEAKASGEFDELNAEARSIATPRPHLYAHAGR